MVVASWLTKIKYSSVYSGSDWWKLVKTNNNKYLFKFSPIKWYFHWILKIPQLRKNQWRIYIIDEVSDDRVDYKASENKCKFGLVIDEKLRKFVS